MLKLCHHRSCSPLGRKANYTMSTWGEDGIMHSFRFSTPPQAKSECSNASNFQNCLTPSSLSLLICLSSCWMSWDLSKSLWPSRCRQGYIIRKQPQSAWARMRNHLRTFSVSDQAVNSQWTYSPKLKQLIQKQPNNTYHFNPVPSVNQIISDVVKSEP